MGHGSNFFASKQNASTVTYSLDIVKAAAAMLAATGLIYNNFNIPIGLIGELPTGFLGMVLLGYSLSMLVPQNSSSQPDVPLKQ